MNKGIVLHYLSMALLLSSALFVVPALVSLYYGEYYFLLIFLCVGAGMALAALPGALYRPKRRYMFAREGMVIASLMWIIFSAVGALPFYLSGSIPHYVDALFESISGFTTTGSSILTDVEALPRGILFWRSFTHWVGGMGVLVLAIAILPSTGNALYLMQAECPGPQVGKLVPKGKTSALYLYLIYGVLTLVTVILLFTGGMPLFDSVCHAMGIAGTGGFGIKNDGVSYYNSPYLEGVITVTMILFGVNFTLYYYLLIRRFREKHGTACLFLHHRRRHRAYHAQYPAHLSQCGKVLSLCGVPGGVHHDIHRIRHGGLQQLAAVFPDDPPAAHVYRSVRRLYRRRL